MSLFDRLYAAGYDWFAAREGPVADEHRRALVEDIAGEALEVGAGTGLNFRFYRGASRVVALEPNDGMRARAREAAKRARVAIELAKGDAHSLPFPDASFDAVVFSLVLCTIPDPGRALSEARRVLRPGGALHFYEHVRAKEARLAAKQDRWLVPWRWFGRGCHCNRETVAAIKAARFRLGSLEEFDMPRVPSLVRPHVRGTAAPES